MAISSMGPAEVGPLPSGAAERRRREPRRPPVRTLLLAGIFILGALYTLYFARSVLVPIAVAVVLNFVFSPAIRAMSRLRIPPPLGATLVLVLVLGGVGLTTYRLAAPASAWVARGPQSLKRLESRLRKIKKPVEQVSRTADQVQQLTSTDDSKTPKVQVQGPTLKDILLGSTQALITQSVVIFTLLYFLLAGGDLFLKKLVKILPRVRDKRLAEQIAHETERSVSSYMLTITVINLCLGIATGLAMFLIGLPNPVLWGVVGGLLNFIPYLGGFIAVAVLGLAGMLTFDQLWHALLPAFAYFVLTNVESFVTPVILGRRFTMNPVVVFISVVFWGWLWGIAGALLAVPLLASFKIICDHVESLSYIGEFLGQ